jgi:hypothetical protein
MAYIGNRRIINIASNEDKFIFVCCKNFDKNFTIMTSFDQNYKMKIKRRLERSMYKVFDMFMDPGSFNEDGFSNSLKILSTRGEQFFVDVVNPQCYVENAE